MRIELSCIAALVLVAVMSADSSAQETWRDYSPPCDRQGSCHLESRGYGYYDRADSIELIPCGTARRQSFRVPTRNELDYYAGYGPSSSFGCEGGACARGPYASQYGSRYDRQEAGLGSCLNGRCRHGAAAFENEFDDRRSSPNAYGRNRQSEYGTNNYSNPNSYANPSERSRDWYGTAPADRRPNLNRPPFAPRRNLPPNNFRSESSNSQLLPPTPTQIILPPKLPP